MRSAVPGVERRSRRRAAARSAAPRLRGRQARLELGDDDRRRSVRRPRRGLQERRGRRGHVQLAAGPRRARHARARSRRTAKSALRGARARPRARFSKRRAATSWLDAEARSPRRPGAGAAATISLGSTVKTAPRCVSSTGAERTVRSCRGHRRERVARHLGRVDDHRQRRLLAVEAGERCDDDPAAASRSSSAGLAGDDLGLEAVEDERGLARGRSTWAAMRSSRSSSAASKASALGLDLGAEERSQTRSRPRKGRASPARAPPRPRPPSRLDLERRRADPELLVGGREDDRLGRVARAALELRLGLLRGQPPDVDARDGDPGGDPVAEPAKAIPAATARTTSTDRAPSAIFPTRTRRGAPAASAGRTLPPDGPGTSLRAQGVRVYQRGSTARLVITQPRAALDRGADRYLGVVTIGGPLPDPRPHRRAETSRRST